MKKQTVDIGIPVYNEESNIQRLILSLLKQQPYGLIKKIIIYDDGSTDDTLNQIEEVSTQESHVQLVLIKSKINRGKSFALQQILKAANSDILVLVDSDIMVTSAALVETLIKPLVFSPQAALTNGLGEKLQSKKPLAKVLNFSAEVMYRIGKKHPLQICWGGLMACKKDFYKSLDIPEGIYRTDAYLYLEAVKRKLAYTLNEEARVLDSKDFATFKFRQYAKIQKRVTTYPEAFGELYETSFFQKESRVPIKDKVFAVLVSAFTMPVAAVYFFFYRLFATIYNQSLHARGSSTWRK